MGIVTHMHSKQELLDRFDVNIDVTPAVSTLMVLENKFSDGEMNATDAEAKARMCVEGTKRQMFIMTLCMPPHQVKTTSSSSMHL